MTPKLVIECICGSHLILVREELLDNDLVYTLTLYSHGVYHPKPKLWKKIKVMWLYVWYGHMFDDQVVIKKEDLASIHEFIGKYLDERRTKIEHSAGSN